MSGKPNSYEFVKNFKWPVATKRKLDIGKFEGKYYVYDKKTTLRLPSDTGKYEDKMVKSKYDLVPKKTLVFTSDRLGKEGYAPDGFKSIKELEHFYNNIFPKNKNAFPYIKRTFREYDEQGK